jgi:outer membrane protein OmpA-like peptidoglycan-associated protein
MFSQSDDEAVGSVLGLVFAAVALMLALVLGIAVQRRPAPAALQASAPVLPALPAPAAPAFAAAPGAAKLSAQAASDAASITVEYGVVKFYFASGQAELAAGAGAALVDIVKGARAGRKVVISGFHDASGHAALNAELARQRALAVREALRAAGVPDRQISLQKPQQTAGTGSDAEARRVEIVLQ